MVRLVGAVQYFSKKKAEYYLILCIAMTAPMTFLSLRPFINIFLVDFFILLYLSFSVFFFKGRKVNIRLLFSVFFIVLGYTLSGLFSEYREEHLIPFIQYCAVFLMLIFFSASTLTADMLRNVLKFYIFGMFISIIISLLLYWGYIAIPNLNIYVAGRFNGVWGNPNSLAKEMIMFIMFLLSLLTFTNLPRLVVYIYSLFLFCSFYLLLSSASFGGVFFLSICFSIFLFLLVRNFPLSKYKSFFLSFLFLSLFFIPFFVFINYNFGLISIVPERFLSRVLTVNDFNDAGSGSFKLNQIFHGLEMFFSSPIVGVGLESSKYYGFNKGLGVGELVGLHSFYVNMMVEGGVFVLIGFILLFSTLFKFAVNSSVYRLVFVVVVVVFLINLIIGNNIYTRYLWFPLAFVIFPIIDKEKEITTIGMLLPSSRVKV